MPNAELTNALWVIINIFSEIKTWKIILKHNKDYQRTLLGQIFS